VWFVVISVIGYVENCGYFSAVRLLNSVVCCYQCYWICGKLRVIQCSEVTEQCGLWLSVLLDMWKIVGHVLGS
jgi:hypothetical protein